MRKARKCRELVREAQNEARLLIADATINGTIDEFNKAKMVRQKLKDAMTWLEILI